MIKNLVALIVGILFGLGLSVSQMTDPNKVLAFLNLSGDWDPSLALVMASALVISSGAFAIARKMRRPLFNQSFQWPMATMIDKKLLTGAVMFGIGWGLVGLCPGPAIASLAAPSANLLLFIGFMFLGMLIGRKIVN